MISILYYLPYILFTIILYITDQRLSIPVVFLFFLKSEGVMPIRFLKIRLKWSVFWNPAISAIRLILRSELIRSERQTSNLVSRRIVVKVMPVALRISLLT